jgi:hypothetical protein
MKTTAMVAEFYVEPLVRCRMFLRKFEEDEEFHFEFWMVKVHLTD